MRPNGETSKYKERLVAKEFLQKLGFDFNEIYAPSPRLETVRLVVAVATYRGWKIYKLDVKLAFLNGPLEEEAYVKKAPGFEIK